MTEHTNNLIPRPPIITVMGHIDHGKSTLLDYIRKTNVVEQEAGGITQHLAAYEVSHEKDGEQKRITFLDTPGHEAFKAMRSRGANIADIAVLVVAADDGVKPQTLEALEAIRQAEIPFIVAINKIDKPQANVQKTINSLVENEVYLEGYGGDISHVALSAKTGENVDELFDLILLSAELEDLKADPSLPAEGTVIESNVDPKRGTSATLVITNGSLKQGDWIVSGESIAPVRLMENFVGEKITDARFSSPIRITGFDSLPLLGSVFHSYSNRKEAESAKTEAVSRARTPLHNTEEAEGSVAIIPVVIKTDVSGTGEAIVYEMEKLETDTVRFLVLSRGVGTVSENDVQLGGENSLILAFNVSVDPVAKEAAKRINAEIGIFTIIYELIEWLQKQVEVRRPREVVEEVTGSAKVLKTFSRKRDRQIIGGRLVEGTLEVKERFRIRRRDDIIGQGSIIGLQQQKASSSKVSEGEFGADVESRIELAPGDMIEAFTSIER